MPADINYSRVPVDYMLEAVQLYIEHGTRCGHFLTALFSNDLMEAFKRADDNNTAAMRKWVGFVYNEMPTGSHGSPAKVQIWQSHRGLEGLKEWLEMEAAKEAEDADC